MKRTIGTMQHPRPSRFNLNPSLVYNETILSIGWVASRAGIDQARQLLGSIQNLAGPLRLLLNTEGLDSVHAAYAEAMEPLLRARFEQTRGVKEVRGKKRKCLHRLFGVKCTDNTFSGLPCHPAGADHVSLWAKDRQPVVYVMQPYDFGADEVESLQELCERYGMTMKQEDELSWHFAVKTHLIEISCA